jgi:regulator of chromosome condensation
MLESVLNDLCMVSAGGLSIQVQITRPSHAQIVSVLPATVKRERFTNMPPRRSTRAASAQPVAKPPPKPASRAKPKSEVKGINGTSNKRSASPERTTPPPPAKRARADAKKSENEPPAPVPARASRKPPSKTATAKKASEPAARKTRKLSPVREVEPASEPKPEPKQLKPYFNPLPTPPEKRRPALLPFVWGAGNFGQFGLGPDVLQELPKPKRHTWAEKKTEDGTFGEEGAGIEFVAAGGLHTVFVDEKGAVRNYQ